ncbi:hypothetical protein GQ55_2G352000 [Panicum hallii var. hallii]|uniref:Uncharacterized protein n=1 Tax=Panicum hallii var. hallii TaxID=1504633 RepID=A0A2T7EVR5_9POAL|nr:hypothetical protein GQ55_2G352000 [Panicum hallii var. hallii]
MPHLARSESCRTRATANELKHPAAFQAAAPAPPPPPPSSSTSAPLSCGTPAAAVPELGHPRRPQAVAPPPPPRRRRRAPAPPPPPLEL